MKRIFILTLTLILILPFTSALTKEVINVAGQKYPDIRIWNDAHTTELAYLRLIHNTEYCSDDCQAIIVMNLFTTWTLPDNPNSNFQFNFWDRARIYLKNNDIRDVRIKVSGSNVSGINMYGGSYSYPNYVNIPWGNAISPGVKYIKIDARKDAGDTVDWVPSFMGLHLTEWANWTNTSIGSGLVAYWDFNETSGNNLQNIFNGSYNISLGNNGHNSSGKSGYAVFCNTSDSSESPEFAQTTDMSVNFWVKVTQGHSGFIVSRWVAGGGKFNFRFDIDAGGVPTVQLSAGSFFITGTKAIANDTWTMVTVKSSPGNHTLYLNGSFAGTNTAAGTSASGATAPMTLCDQGGSGGGTLTKASVDELAWWSRAINYTEIAELYNNGVGLFYYDGLGGETPPADNSIVSTLINPANNHHTNNTAIVLTAQATPGTAMNITNVTFYYALSSVPAAWAVLNVNTTSVNTNFSINISYGTTLVADLNYTWNARVCGTNGTFTNCSFASTNRTFIMDQTIPRISFTSPSNGTEQTTVSNSSTFSFNYSFTESNPNTCWYYNTTANVTLTNCGTNFSIPLGSGYKKVIVYINDSAGNMNQSAVTVLVNRIMPYVIYKPAVSEGENFRITFNVTADLISTINGTIKYNNTFYNLVFFSNNSTTASLYSDISAPTNGTVWFNVTYAINGFSNITASFPQNVTGLTLSLCNAVNNIPFINYSFRNATSPYTSITATLSGTWYYRTSTNLTNIKNYSLLNDTGSHSYPICLSPAYASYYVDSDIVFGNSSYHTNTYHDVNDLYTNLTTNITLYLLSSGLGTSTVHKVQSSAQTALVGHHVYIYIYDTGTNTYKLFSVLKTNNDGQDVTYLNWYDTFYKYTITDRNDTAIYWTNDTKVFATPKTFIVFDTSSDIYGKFYGVISQIYWYNNSRNVSAVFSDPNLKITGGCLRVIRMNNGISTILITTCINGTSGNINYTIASGINGTFWGVFYATGSTGWIDSVIQFHILDYTTDIYSQLGNLDGSTLALIVVGTCVMLGIFFGPAVTILSAILGFIASFLLGFVSVNDTDFIIAFLGFASVGGYLIYKLKT